MTLRDLKEILKNLIKKSEFLISCALVARTLFSPRQQYAVWKDFWQYRQDIAFFRHERFPVDASRRTALLVLASDMVYEAKTQGMLAMGLTMQGWRVVFLISRLSRWARRYLRGAYGYAEFVSWEDFPVSAAEKDECRREAKSFLQGPMIFPAVKQWMYRNAWIGPQLISVVSRRIMEGAPDLGDPRVRRRLEQLLPETLENVHMAGHILNHVRPALLSLIEANYPLMGALVDTAISRKISVIQTIQPVRDDALILKKLTAVTRRMHPASVSPESMALLEAMPWTAQHEERLQQEFQKRYGGAWFLQSRNQPGVKEKNREEIIHELNLDPRRKTAIVFSPVLWDANLFYGEDLFEDYGDWFVQTVRAACANPRVNWIIKMHPANLWKRAREKATQELSEVALIKQGIGPLPPHVALLYPQTDISTWSLFRLADYGITVRGTVGMELPCLGVPVFTAGTGRYSGFGFTVDSASREEYLEKLAKIEEFGPLSQAQQLLAKKHAYGAFLLRPWVMESFRAVFGYKKSGVHPLDHNLLVQVHSLDELRRNGDLERWARWAADPTKMDYLEQPESSSV